MANEVLMQLFINGPTWDGNLISKTDRNILIKDGYASKVDGWNFLTEPGVNYAVSEGLKARNWHDKRFYRKAAILN